jgi:hypothetical protein
MKPKDLGQVLNALIPTRTAIDIESAPGLGKSSIAYQAAASVYDGATVASAVGGFPQVPWFLPIRAVDRDPIDFRGVLYVKDGKSEWTVPDIIDKLTPDGGVICIEELPQAVPAVQCVLRELLLERAIAGHRIPDTWSVIATGNRQQDRAGAGRLLSHVASSVVVLELEASLDDWQAWAIEAGIQSEIRAFLRFKPDCLHQFEPGRKLNADPRAWERVSRIYSATPERLRGEVFGGCVGQAAAGAFLDFITLYAQLPDPDEVLKSPGTAPVPEEASVRWANGRSASPAAVYAARLPAEFAVKMFVDLAAVDPQVIASRTFVDWHTANPAVQAAFPTGG